MAAHHTLEAGCQGRVTHPRCGKLMVVHLERQQSERRTGVNHTMYSTPSAIREVRTAVSVLLHLSIYAVPHIQCLRENYLSDGGCEESFVR